MDDDLEFILPDSTTTTTQQTQLVDDTPHPYIAATTTPPAESADLDVKPVEPPPPPPPPYTSTPDVPDPVDHFPPQQPAPAVGPPTRGPGPARSRQRPALGAEAFTAPIADFDVYTNSPPVLNFPTTIPNNLDDQHSIQFTPHPRTQPFNFLTPLAAFIIGLFTDRNHNALGIPTKGTLPYH